MEGILFDIEMFASPVIPAGGLRKSAFPRPGRFHGPFKHSHLRGGFAQLPCRSRKMKTAS